MEKLIIEKHEDTAIKWNPMLEESRSFLNSFSQSVHGDPIAVFTGTQELKTQNIACKFFKPNSGRKTCGKFNCQYLHDEGVAVGRQTKDEKLATPVIVERITLLSELPSKTLAADGIINCGVVVAIVDPTDFYIIPHEDWTCACTKESVLVEEDVDNRCGTANLLNLWEDLKNMTQIITEQHSTYSANQLVAVKIRNETDRGKQWFRAVVLEDTLLGETSELPTVQLRLLDFGTYVSATTDKIIPLPRKLLRYPQLGYRCALNGISPITHRWSKRAIETFRHLTHGHQCIYEVKRTVLPGLDESDHIFEANPYLVELIVKQDGKYVNITDEFGSEGLGLIWNHFPTRPSIFKDVPNPRSLALLLAKEPPHAISIDAQIDPKIFEREEGRLEKYLNRCSLPHRVSEPKLTVDLSKNNWRFRSGSIVGEAEDKETHSTYLSNETNFVQRNEVTPVDSHHVTKGTSRSTMDTINASKYQISEINDRKERRSEIGSSKLSLTSSGADLDNNWRSEIRPTQPTSSALQISHPAQTVQSKTGNSNIRKKKWKKLDLK